MDHIKYKFSQINVEKFKNSLKNIKFQPSTVGQYTFEVSAKTRRYLIGLYR